MIAARPALERRRRLLAIAWLATVAVAAGSAALSTAMFADRGSIDGPVSAGTISLGLVPVSTLITFGGMVPGDHADGALTVLNAGTGGLRYAMTGVATDPDGKHLRDVLLLDVERRAGCGGALLEVLYSGPIGGAAFGDAQPGSHAGDRPLDPAASEVLCFRATLPVGTDILLEGATTTATLTFWAEQVAGNP